MSWNIEVLCIGGSGVEVEQAVPDVFGPTGERFCFEDATSVARGDELCAARIGEWIVVIDIGCRLSGNASYLEEASAGRTLHVFRIAGVPLHLEYRDGEKKHEQRGVAACLNALTGKPDDAKDGERLAQDLLEEQTGLGWMNELFDAEYQAFALD